MKPRLSKRPEAGLTAFEVGVVVAVLLILIALVLPMLGRPPYRSSKLNCTNNLRQIGLAYRIWEGDNGDMYPMGVSVTNGGAREMVAIGDAVLPYVVMSNELSSVRILTCPADAKRIWPTNFIGLSNSNISYFVGADVTNDAPNPQMFLSGDCDFDIAGRAVKPGLLSLWTNAPVKWSTTRHIKSGNLGLADGSVLGANDSGLRTFLVQTDMATNMLAIP